MKKLIIIRGPLGIGKTTIAKKLAGKLNAYYVSMDTVLAENGLDKAVEGAGIPVTNFIKGNELVLPKVQSALEEGKPVIIDGCFYHKEQIEHFIKSTKANPFVFTLKAPVKTCIERDKNRPHSYGEGAVMAVHSMVLAFDYGTSIETKGKTVEQTAQEILKVIE